MAEGADVYQLFDSWAGMLDEAEYDRWAQPRHQAILKAVLSTYSTENAGLGFGSTSTTRTTEATP